MVQIKRHTQFLLDKEKEKPDAKLRYRIRWNGNTVAFNVGYRITIDKWSLETQRCKNGTSHGKAKINAADINKAIQSMEDAITDIFYAFEAKGQTPTADELRSAYNVSIGKEKGPEERNSISFVSNQFILHSGGENAWTPSTIAKVKTITRHLIDVLGDIPVNNISEAELAKVSAGLIKTDHRNTTVTKNMKIAKWMFRWASRKGYYSGHAHEKFNPKLKGTSGKLQEIIYLTWAELMHLYNLPLKSSSQSNVRDVFCFCCFSGLRYSDVAKLKKSDIRDNTISIVTTKTDEVLKIDLNKYSKALLDKYREIPLPNGRALPVITNQKMNDYLKVIGKAAEFNELITLVYFKGSKRYEESFPKHELLTTHCGRRTFVVNALTLGVPAEVIMKWTGHSGFEAMKPYMEIVDKLKANEMQKFNID
jgi:integrase